ncbi:hypothetical protein BV898_14816 [Hypsibius exemplaris]|uniref:Kazal-like domain-containing protein n=1 Tax=Hypsibius exemplaris TaxID=2072580 RepID=A0A9X6NBC9_HYPEX|nr:hypothetical protein BV898_14816 [Hypsibius exemplaris]
MKLSIFTSAFMGIILVTTCINLLAHEGDCSAVPVVRVARNSSGLPCACSPKDDPACGMDGMTYFNSCHADCNGLALQHSGPCSKEQGQL